MGFEPGKFGPNISTFYKYLEEKGLLTNKRPQAREFSGRMFVLEEMLATKVVFQVENRNDGGPKQLAVWVSNPSEDPDLTINYYEPNGTMLYLIEAYYPGEDDKASLHPTSGFSALASSNS